MDREMDETLTPHRLPNETFEAYKARRKKGNEVVDLYMKSQYAHQLKWPSFIQGTYKRKEHGEL